jgi:hypothetical protein
MATVALLPTVTPTPQPTMSVAQGSLSVESLAIEVVEPPSFAVALDGREQAIDATMALLLSDHRLMSSGWHLQIAVQVVGPTPGRGLSNATFTIPTVAVSCLDPSCILPLSTLHAGMTAPTFLAGEPVAFLNAAPGSGTGALSIRPTLRIYLPADAYAGNYEIVVDVAIAEGS